MQDKEEEKIKAAVVRVEAKDGEAKGTGFFVGPGWVLTCQHVVEDYERSDIKVHARSGRQEWSREVIYWVTSETDADLRLLRIDKKDTPNLSLSKKSPSLFANKQKRYLTFTKNSSYELELERIFEENSSDYFTIKSAEIIHGDSGSPLVEVETGEVCGVIYWSRNNNELKGGRALTVEAVRKAFPGVFNYLAKPAPTVIQTPETKDKPLSKKKNEVSSKKVTSSYEEERAICLEKLQFLEEAFNNESHLNRSFVLLHKVKDELEDVRSRLSRKYPLAYRGSIEAARRSVNDATVNLNVVWSLKFDDGGADSTKSLKTIFEELNNCRENIHKAFLYLS